MVEIFKNFFYIMILLMFTCTIPRKKLRKFIAYSVLFGAVIYVFLGSIIFLIK